MDSDTLWNIVSVVVKDRLVTHHQESYELFLEKYIPEMVNEYRTICVTHDDGQKTVVTFDNVVYGEASFTNSNNKHALLYPHQAMQSNLNYCLPMYVDITVSHKDINYNLPRELVAHLPIMKGSKYCNTQKQFYSGEHECKTDPGCYFIIKGNEKVIICQERIMDNKCFLSYRPEKKFSYIVEIRSNKDVTQMANVFRIMSDKNRLQVSWVNLKTPVCLFTLFAYFGASTDAQILQYIIGKDQSCCEAYLSILSQCFTDWHNIQSTLKEQDISLEKYLNNKFTNKQIQLSFVTQYRILPHLSSSHEKLIFLGFMTRKLLNFMANGGESIDRDSLTNKRIETSGILLAQLFRKLWRDTINCLKTAITNEQDWKPQAGQLLKTNIITNKMVNSLATGNWDSKISSDHKKFGVAQLLKRLNYIATLSHLRRINSPVNKTGKLIQPRKLHNSLFGFFCAAESPEGQQIGLIKHLSLATLISTFSDPKIIKELCLDRPDIFQTISIENVNEKSAVPVLINGCIVGQTTKPWKLVTFLRKKRQNGQINYMVSISFKPQAAEIIIHTDEGRPLRPLFVVQENNKFQIADSLLKQIQQNDFRLIDLLNNGVIEYIDATESECVLIARNIQELETKTVTYSHAEIHPSLIFGVSACNIPFAQHNQAPRVLYQCAQAQQAVGFNNSEVLRRMDTLNHILHHIQRPLVYTKTSKLIKCDSRSFGTNVIVAICCFDGYNIEDSLILNEGAVRRGLFHLTCTKTYKNTIHKESSLFSSEIIALPNEQNCIHLKKKDLYHALDENGIVKIGSKVRENDVLIGKLSPIIGSNKDVQYMDTSIQMKQHITGTVDQVMTLKNSNNTIITKIKIRSIRKPEIGDKCCSRHGQKGTIGIVLPEEDMPFSETGMIPDIIINPHCLPSRMTIGQILESVLGKFGAYNGEFIDGTAFSGTYDTNKLDELLLSTGFSGSGKEVLFNSATGERMQSKIFIGPTYYQRLKHMVSDKIHARSQGPVNRLTQQPTEGRSRKGGLKLGTMELDCLHAHGVAHFLKEKFFDCSDKFYVHICRNCKYIANVNEKKRIYNCSNCSDHQFAKIALPVSSKLLFYELIGMGIVTKYHV